MALKQQTNSLLKSIKQLQSKIGLLILGKQLKEHQVGSDTVPHDIMEPLSQYLEKLSVFADEDPQGKEYKASWDVVQSFNKKESIEQTQPVEIEEIENQARSDLANHFKSNTTEKGTHPYLIEKLQNSTWEHIHTAIRLAHQGAQVKAKLHADIANNALKEVAQYMNKEDYAKFVNEINSELVKLHF